MPVNPGQQPGLLQRLDRHGDARPGAAGGGGELLVGGKASPAAIGPVEAPEERAEHAQRGPGQRALVLPLRRFCAL